MPPTCLKWRSHQGQALVEMLVLLPVLLLLLLAASDMGKLAAISGKCEIAARYTALAMARGEPFASRGGAGELDPSSVASEVERTFFQGSLDDEVEEGSEPQDVRYLSPDVFYPISHISSPLLTGLWPNLWVVGLRPIRHEQILFDYNLTYFPYRKWQSLPEPEGAGGPAEWMSPIASEYEAQGDFVAQLDAFTGESGERVRSLILGLGGIIPFTATLGDIYLILAVLAILFG